MHVAHRILSSLLLTAALAAPVAMIAAPVPQRVGVQVRVYDRSHKDYHNWDDREESSYRRYLAEQHRDYRVYAKQRRRDQDQYWNWRHAHSDDR
jgi:hypothetical protein